MIYRYGGESQEKTHKNTKNKWEFQVNARSPLANLITVQQTSHI